MSGPGHEELIQGSQEWQLARCGSLGASRLHEAVAQTKSGWGASRANLMAELIAERLTGIPAAVYVNAAMQWGTDQEPAARAAYEFYCDAEVVQVGIVKHSTIAGTHASPDGLVGSDGLLEIKAPNTSTHIDTLLSGVIPEKYIKQMMWQMACTGRKWCDFASYDPRMPESMRLYIRRIERSDSIIENLEKEVSKFLTQLDAAVAELRAKYETVAEAA